MAGLSSAGIGSGLDVQGIIDKLMAAEGNAPRAALNNKEASYQTKLSAYGSLSGALSSLQAAFGALNNQNTFKAVNAMPSDTTLFTASASSTSGVGNYSINVTKLAQAQTLASAGQASTTATIGSGTTTKLTFQFGTLSTGGNLSMQSANLSAAVASGGIAAGSLSINGTTITTGAGTNSAKALAAAINLQNGTTGVTAAAQTTDTGALGAFTTTTGAATYTLNVGGVNVISNGAVGTQASDIDTAVAAAAGALTAAGISYTGSAAMGTLKFTKADGDNVAIQESGAGASGGFASSIGMGTTKTFTSSVSLTSATTLTVGGSNPSAAGLSAGSGTRSFTQSGDQPSASITIDNTNNSLQGIRDAINKANIGVTASIVSDGNATNPYHLVIKSNKTGEQSSMQISVQSGGDAALASLLSFDASGTTMTETSTAQNAALTVNGIAVTSQTNSVSGAIEGVSLELAKTGAGNLNISRNTSSVKSAVDGFVKAFNDVNSTIQKLTSYNADTKQGGPLIGDSAVRTIQTELRKMLSSPVEGTNSTLKTLRDVGITVSKDGVMSVDSTKLSAAMSKDLDDVAALFSTVGKTTDSLVSFVSAGSKSAPGEYEVAISRLATQGNATGSQDLRSSPVTITSSNQDLTVTVNGTTAAVSLKQGTYNATEIAALVQSSINGASELSSQGIAVSVTVDANGHLVITSNKYGSESKVSVSGASVATLMGTATSTDGLDVAGTIAGVAAKGDGQYLIGADGSPAAGLKLQIAGGAVPTPPATSISRGLVNFSKGYAFHLNDLVSGFLGDKGLLGSRTDGLNRSIKDIAKQRDALETRLALTEARYRKQFTALDATISKMNSTSTYLTQQLAQLGNLSKQ